MVLERNRKLPRENIADILQLWGFLKDVTIEPPDGRITLVADAIYLAMSSSALALKTGRNEDVEKEMNEALRLLKAVEPFRDWEQIIDGKPHPTHWSSNDHNLRDCYRFGIEIYNGLALDYQKKGLRIMPLHIEEGRLNPVPTQGELEQRSMYSALL
jgi:hypothetical protein